MILDYNSGHFGDNYNKMKAINGCVTFRNHVYMCVFTYLFETVSYQESLVNLEGPAQFFKYRFISFIFRFKTYRRKRAGGGIIHQLWESVHLRLQFPCLEWSTNWIFTLFYILMPWESRFGKKMLRKPQNFYLDFFSLFSKKLNF